jgi:hypothetical protein
MVSLVIKIYFVLRTWQLQLKKSITFFPESTSIGFFGEIFYECLTLQMILLSQEIGDRVLCDAGKDWSPPLLW